MDIVIHIRQKTLSNRYSHFLFVFGFCTNGATGERLPGWTLTKRRKSGRRRARWIEPWKGTCRDSTADGILDPSACCLSWLGAEGFSQPARSARRRSTNVGLMLPWLRRRAMLYNRHGHMLFMDKHVGSMLVVSMSRCFVMAVTYAFACL